MNIIILLLLFFFLRIAHTHYRFSQRAMPVCVRNQHRERMFIIIKSAYYGFRYIYIPRHHSMYNMGMSGRMDWCLADCRYTLVGQVPSLPTEPFDLTFQEEGCSKRFFSGYLLSVVL